MDGRAIQSDIMAPTEEESALRQKLSETNYSMKMMWGCAALILVAMIVAIAGHAYVLLFVIPCMLMMGAMVWMMMGGGRRGSRNR